MKKRWEGKKNEKEIKNEGNKIMKWKNEKEKIRKEKIR